MSAVIAFLAWAAVVRVFVWSAESDHVVSYFDNYSVRTKLLLIPVCLGWIVPLLFV